MTNRELNRDIKRLYNNYKLRCGEQATDEYFNWLEKTVKPEFSRLYNADNTFQVLTADNIRRMLVLNRVLRVVPFHQFGIYIEV